MRLTKPIVFILFAIVAFAIYYNSLTSDFHFDDDPSIAGNSAVAINNLSLSALKKAAFWNKDKLRSVSYLSFALNYYFSRERTTSYHVINVIVHIINAFLIYLIILKLFGSDSDDEETRRRLTISAFFTALIWLVTPLNSMAVIYIVQRMTLLMTLFFLLSFFCYIKGRKGAHTPWFVLSFVFFVLSVMSKENGITVILVIVLYEFIFNKKGDIKNITKKELLILLALFVILMTPVIIYRAAIIHQFSGREYEWWGFTLGERYLTQFRVMVFALSLLLLPLPQRLSVTHDIAISKSLFTPITTLPAIFLMTFLFIFSLMRMKKNPYFSFAALVFFITISVEVILPLELFYEHRMYLPSIFLIGVAVDYAVQKYYERSRKTVMAALISLVILLSVLTMIRGLVWENEFTLWNDVLSKYPEESRAIFNLGFTYYQSGDYEKALEIEKKALNIYLKLYGEYHPDVANCYGSIGLIYSNLGDYKKSLEYYEKALNIDLKIYSGEEYSHLAGIYSSIGLALSNLGDYKKALEYYKKTLEIDLKIYDETHRFIAGDYSNVGLALNKLGDYDNALKYNEKALALRLKNYGEEHPDVAEAYVNLGETWYSLGDYKKALEYSEKAYAIDIKLLGSEHPDIKMIINNIKITKEKMNEKRQ